MPHYACCCEAESWITKCGLKLIYETLPGKEVVCVQLITSILGRLPVIRAGDTCTISFSYGNARDAATGPIAMTTPSPKPTPLLGPGNMYFVDSCRGAGLFPRPMKLNEAQCMICIVNHYYNILFSELLLLIFTIFVITLLLHYYVLLHHSLIRIVTVFVITLLLQY